ncbi:hypothetical protein MTX78_06290 [Hymenobacter tibetensis]|uniref:Glycosyltransferase RgtA/B/C/D-like domain-containing protein n=1 Tax=Hymenobacter tibetensis TaxID=497967 RepID=A0ABY4D1W2_9BACT|nr:hypothetical protein [Hymenobacter tibetensis]UOG76202.1 hypothetical protein MTX78_06290 [Hymenobacter tibetensis]
MPRSQVIRWVVSHYLALIAVGLALGLLPFLALCQYNQPYLCDFSVSSDTFNYGIWGAQPYLFQQWSGRYFSNFLLYVANPLSYRWLEGVKWVAAISQVLRIAVLYLVIRRLTGQQLRRSEAGLFAAGLTLVYVALAPYRFSVLYYFTEITVYQVATWLLVLVPLAVERLHRAASGRARKAWGVAAVLGTIAAAGSNELTLVQLGWLMAVAAGLSLYRRQYRSFQIWGSLGVLLLLCGTLSVLAPGNTARQHLDGAVAPAASVWEAASRLVVLLRYLFVEPAMLVVPVLTLVLAPVAARTLPARPPGLQLPLLLSAVVLVGGVVLATAPYALMLPRPSLLPRATNAMVWWWLLGWIVAAWASLPPAPATVPTTSLAVRTLVGVVLLVIVLIPSGRAYLDLQYDAPAYARNWEERFQALQRAGHTPHTLLQVPPPPPFTNRFNFLPPDDLSTMPEFGVNTRLATWFGVDSVRVEVSN